MKDRPSEPMFRGNQNRTHSIFAANLSLATAIVLSSTSTRDANM